MTLAFRLIALSLALVLPALPAAAQDRIWVQIEAQPDLAQALERARAYAAVFPETQGYRLRSGWYGIVLGPYGVAEGAAQLTGLKRENLIPGDSYVTDGAEFREPFWPEAGAAPVAPPAPEVADAPEPVAEPAPAPLPEPEPVAVDETPAEARASEALLSEDDRKLLQTALAWFGFYQSGIDGAFGPGTRGSMAAWQESLGLEPTGILTTRERATLVANYQAEVAEYGFAPLSEPEAGIEATLPLNLVEFDHYEPPFVHFREKGGSGLRIVLISQPGDIAAFYGLYDVLQTLTDIPPEGERGRSETAFSITGQSATRTARVKAEYRRGLIKGWMVLSTPATAERDARVIEALEASFKGVGDLALDPGLVALEEAARRGLMAGLEVRRPLSSGTGFWIDGSGTVLTTAAAVKTCGRVTLERDIEASVALTADGIAVLRPERALAPPAFAMFQLSPERVGAEVAVAGYSYGDRLPAPVLTYGVLEELTGLDGEPGVKRLAITALPGDAGGPVVDATGAVLGMLLPPGTGTARVLPEGVAFAASATRIAQALAPAGITLAQDARTGALPPEDLAAGASALTVLVSCWE